MSTSLPCFKDKLKHLLTKVHSVEAEFVRVAYRGVGEATGGRVPFKQPCWKVCTQHGCFPRDCGARVPSSNPSPSTSSSPSQRSWGYEQLGPELHANGWQDSEEKVPLSLPACSKININSQAASLWPSLVSGPAELGDSCSFGVRMGLYLTNLQANMLIHNVYIFIAFQTEMFLLKI